MDNKEFKKSVKQMLKIASGKIIFNNINTKYRSDGYDFYLMDQVVGRMGYAFVSNKFADFGASFGLYVVAAINDADITLRLKSLGLSYPNYSRANHFFGFSSLYYFTNKFYKTGTASFYEKDDVEKKCNEVVALINNLYVPKIQNFIDGDLNLLEDIFSTPENFGFPMAYALITCYKNNRKDLIDEVIKRGRQKKLYDSSQIKIDEILLKLNSLYST